MRVRFTFSIVFKAFFFKAYSESVIRAFPPLANGGDLATDDKFDESKEGYPAATDMGAGSLTITFSPYRDSALNEAAPRGFKVVQYPVKWHCRC